jgi:hypothetical protein
LTDRLIQRTHIGASRDSCRTFLEQGAGVSDDHFGRPPACHAFDQDVKGCIGLLDVDLSGLGCLDQRLREEQTKQEDAGDCRALQPIVPATLPSATRLHGASRFEPFDALVHRREQDGRRFPLLLGHVRGNGGAPAESEQDACQVLDPDPLLHERVGVLDGCAPLGPRCRRDDDDLRGRRRTTDALDDTSPFLGGQRFV